MSGFSQVSQNPLPKAGEAKTEWMQKDPQCSGTSILQFLQPPDLFVCVFFKNPFLVNMEIREYASFSELL